MFNVSGMIANNFAGMVLDCYRFANSIELYNVKKFKNFVDINDIYSSFLLNLLAKSLNLRYASENLVTYETNKDWVKFAEEAAKLARLITDFESAT